MILQKAVVLHGLIKAIKVFQAATKPQGTFSGKYIDGRVDPNYSTIKKLRSHLAPKWVHFQTIIENKRISNKICCITSNSKKIGVLVGQLSFYYNLQTIGLQKKLIFYYSL